MKHEKYTLLILPDNEASGRSFSINASTLRIMRWGGGLLLLALLVLLVVFVPRAASWSEINAENEYLLEEREQVTSLLKNVKRIEEINYFIENTLGGYYDLDGSSGDSLVDLESDWEVSPFETMGLLEDLPTYLPIKGFVNARYQIREGHFNTDHLGVDLSSIDDRVVKAAGRGFVIFSDWTYRYGNTIIIDHGNGYMTVYGHNERNLVQQRQVVERAEPIAIMGNTGLSAAAHLHFEIWHNGVPLDPATMIVELKDNTLSDIPEGNAYGEPSSSD